MDEIKLTGRARIVVRDADGQIVHVAEHDNLVVEDGFNLAAALIAGEAVSAISHMAAGDSSIEPVLADSDLQGTEQARTTVNTSRSDNEITYTANFSGISSDVDVSEFGLFNNSSGGTMFARFLTETFTLFAGQDMEIDWTIRVGQ